MPNIIPPYLKKGDSIGIMCPAGYMAKSNVKACVNFLKSWGYQVRLGKTVGGTSKNYFSASDEERLQELQSFLDDPSIKAILFARGGYGTGKLLDRLDFTRFQQQPKWLIGFSDITILQTHILRQFQIVSLHAPMAGAFLEEKYDASSIESLRQSISGIPNCYYVPSNPFNLYGRTKGVLTGGNLAMLANSIGTDSELDTSNRILFIEDTGEYLYNLDRMLTQLQRAGKFKKLKGAIVGGFTDMKDTIRPFGKKTYQIIAPYFESLGIPVAYDFPVSHGKENFSLKSGAGYVFQVSKEGVILEEI